MAKVVRLRIAVVTEVNLNLMKRTEDLKVTNVAQVHGKIGTAKVAAHHYDEEVTALKHSRH